MPTAFMVSLVASDLLAYAPYVTGTHSHLACLLALFFNVGGYLDHACVYGGSMRERLLSTLPWMPTATATAIAGYLTAPAADALGTWALAYVAGGALLSRPLWLWALGVRASSRGRRGYEATKDS
jgi:TctA family transporter